MTGGVDTAGGDNGPLMIQNNNNYRHAQMFKAGKGRHRQDQTGSTGSSRYKHALASTGGIRQAIQAIIGRSRHSRHRQTGKQHRIKHTHTHRKVRKTQVGQGKMIQGQTNIQSSTTRIGQNHTGNRQQATGNIKTNKSSKQQHKQVLKAGQQHSCVQRISLVHCALLFCFSILLLTSYAITLTCIK